MKTNRVARTAAAGSAAAAMASEASLRQAFATPGRLLALAFADKAPVSEYSAFTEASSRLSQAVCSEHAIRMLSVRLPRFLAWPSSGHDAMRYRDGKARV